MKILDTIVYWLCWAALSSAQSAGPLSTCALNCTLQTLMASGCSLQATACQCSSRNLAVLTSECMLANCTMAESLALSKFEAGLCKLPVQDRSQLIVSVVIAVTVLASVSIVARLLSRTTKGSELSMEDWIIAAALNKLLAIPAIVFTFKMASKGFGKDLYSLEDGDLLAILKDFYIAENIYVVVLATTKLSILAFYLRIFQNQYWFRVAVWTTIGTICLSTAIISVLTLVQCNPIEFFWNRDIKTGVCLDVNALAYTNSAMSMAQDIIIITLPIPIVWGLNLARLKKIGVAFMFALGGFGCIVSAIGLRVLLRFGNSIDPSWDYVFVVIWTAIELGVAMVLSCLPALRALLIRLYPNGLLSSLWSSKSHPPSSEDSRLRRNWIGKKKDFMELSDLNAGMTNITWNGKNYKYPRKAPVVPMKIIWRESDGKFKTNQWDGDRD